MPTREEIIYDEYKNNKYNHLTLDDSFLFHCKVCGECCRNRNDILLTPYDISRACRSLNITTSEFISKYCDMYIGQSSNVPVVSFHFKEVNIGKKYTVCPMLRKRDGMFKCTIHEAKPVVCALYPLGRLYEFDIETGLQKISYFLQKTTCGEGGSHINVTVKDWLSNFNIEESESCSNVFNAFVVDVFKMIDFEKFKSNKKIQSEHINKFYDIFANKMYIDILWDEDIVKVMTQNLKELREFVIDFVEYLLNCDINIKAKKQ